MTGVCPDCGAPIAYGSTRCRTCAPRHGPLPPRYCPDCGKPVGRRSTRCRSCFEGEPSRCVDCGEEVRPRTVRRCGACARGEKRAHSKLTERDVVEIRALVDGGVSQRRVARRFGVSQSLIGRIFARKAWAHVD